MTRREDAFSGVWVLDTERSQFTTPSPKRWVLTVQAQGSGMSVREDITHADGTQLVVVFAPKFDGAEYAVAGSSVMDTISYTRTSDRSLDGTGMKDHVVTMRDTAVVSEDGKALTLAYKIFVREHVVATGTAIFRRS